MARVTKRFKLNNARLSYVKLVEPGDTFDGTGKEYSCQVVIPKTHDQYRELVECRNSILQEAFPKATTAQKKSMKILLRDADEEGKSEEQSYLQGCIFFNAKRRESFGPVPCFDRRAAPMVPTNDTIYSGMVANVMLTLYSYDTQSKGVACGIDGVQVVDNQTAERWDNRADVGGAFEALDPDDVKNPRSAPVTADVEEGDDDIPW